MKINKRGEVVLACGCTHDDSKWLKLCPKARAEIAEIHLRWANDRLRAVGARDVPPATPAVKPGLLVDRPPDVVAPATPDEIIEKLGGNELTIEDPIPIGTSFDPAD